MTRGAATTALLVGAALFLIGVFSSIDTTTQLPECVEEDISYLPLILGALFVGVGIGALDRKDHQ